MTDAELREMAEKATPGPWSVFVDDSGTGEWTGWPLSIYADGIPDKNIVRPGGIWPYSWDAKTSIYEANANAAFIAAFNPATALALLARLERAEKALTTARECLTGEPDYHHQGMGCGLEDSSITDRYEAMEHGWERAMERVYGEHINGAIEAIDAALTKDTSND